MHGPIYKIWRKGGRFPGASRKNLLSVAFAIGASAEPAPVSAEAALPCSPILAALNPPVGMPEIWTADPPKEGNGAKASA